MFLNKPKIGKLYHIIQLDNYVWQQRLWKQSRNGCGNEE
jgi:hypothetical protein